MRKRQMMKQAIFLAICLTLFIIWQRKLLTDDVVVADDTTNKNLNGLSDLDLPLHDQASRFLRINKTRVSVLYGRDFGMPTKSINIIKNDSLDHLHKVPTDAIKTDKLFNSHKRSRVEYEESTKKIYKDKLSNNSERVVDSESRNHSNSNGSHFETGVPSKNETLHHHQITPELTPKSPPKEELIEKRPKEDDVPSDDDGESDFVRHMWKNNFQRLEVDDDQDASTYRKNEDDVPESQKYNKESIGSKLDTELQSPKNVLLDSQRVNDNREDFFGRRPTFQDYDLPVINNSGKSTSHNVQEKVSPPSTMENFASLSTALMEEETMEDEDNDREAPVDEIMEGVLILGRVNATKKYAVFSTTTEGRNSLSYIFYVPLTVLAWKRIGFDSVVIIVGSKAEWESDPLLYHVLSTAQKLDCVVIFLEPRPEKSVMISQVARIFAANILRSAFTGIDDVYMIMSDTDLWPIYGDIYNLPPGKKILSLNSDCCSPFNHRRTKYKMIPMANVGMTVRSWRKITQRFGESPKTIDDILTYFVQEFGTVALRLVQKGDNIGWFLDQMMISILITKWSDVHGSKMVKYVPRDVGVDRIDRASWSFGQNSIEDKVDAHLLLEAYIPGVWVRITHLLREMYGDMTQRYVWCVEYYEEFQKLFLDKYRTKQ